MSSCKFHETGAMKTFSFFYFLDINVLSAKLRDVRVIFTEIMAEAHV